MGLSGARRYRMHYQQGSQQLNAPTALGRFAHPRSATGSAARQRPRPGAEIAGGEVSRVMLHEFEHSCPPTIISKSSLNVCFWHKADTTRLSSMSAFGGIADITRSAEFHLLTHSRCHRAGVLFLGDILRLALCDGGHHVRDRTVYC